ncbi:MAG TPA: hypothetical protein VN026_09835, partial [Bacteroidia bacterium]|nr:hypothetical protein [Bacteroidia bacterium]
MNLTGDINSLRTSWTKYDIVQTINIVAENEIDLYLKKEKGIDEPILRSFLGINTLNDNLNASWIKIKEYPIEIRRLFALLAAIFTHHEIIDLFAKEYSLGDMRGVMKMKEGKQYTNLRSALVESGASEKIYRRKTEIPYDFAKIYELGEVGILFKKILEERLQRVGFNADSFRDNFY